MTALRHTVFRWLSAPLGSAAMYFAWRVEEFDRVERDHRHADEWRAELARARAEGSAP